MKEGTISATFVSFPLAATGTATRDGTCSTTAELALMHSDLVDLTAPKVLYFDFIVSYSSPEVAPSALYIHSIQLVTAQPKRKKI